MRTRFPGIRSITALLLVVGFGFHPGRAVWGEREAEAVEPEPEALAKARGRAPVVIAEHEGRWGDLTGVDPGGGLTEGGSFYVIRGAIRNDSDRPIGYVRFTYELVDEAGKVVFREHGYNRRAEDLRDDAFEKGKKPLETMAIEPIEASGKDSFRMFFFGEEIPRFERYRVRVDEVREPSGGLIVKSGPAATGAR